MAVAAVTPAPGSRAGDIVRVCRQWLRQNWLRTVIVSLISFTVSWGWNTYLMAKKLEGDVPPEGSTTTATAQGEGWNGIYWLLVATIIFGIVEYGRERGFKQMVRDLVALPRLVADSTRRSPRGAAAMLLWGGALGLSVGAVISRISAQAAAGVLGVGFLLVAASPLATVVNSFLIRIWVGIFSALAPQSKEDADHMGNPFLMMVGEAAGVIIAWRIDATVALIVVAIGLAVCSYLLVVSASEVAPAVTRLLVFAFGGYLTWRMFRSGVAWADDGGWLECVDPETGTPCSELGFLDGIRTWVDSDGADRLIRRGMIGGYFGAVGGALGATLGGGLGRIGSAILPSGPTQPVTYSGQTAIDTLAQRGVVIETAPGTYEFAPGQSPESARALFEGNAVPAPEGGWSTGAVTDAVIADARVDVTPSPDGLLRAGDVTVRAELALPESPAAAFDSGAPPPPPPGAPSAFEGVAGSAQGAAGAGPSLAEGIADTARGATAGGPSFAEGLGDTAQGAASAAPPPPPPPAGAFEGLDSAAAGAVGEPTAPGAPPPPPPPPPGTAFDAVTDVGHTAAGAPAPGTAFDGVTDVGGVAAGGEAPPPSAFEGTEAAAAAGAGEAPPPASPTASPPGESPSLRGGVTDAGQTGAGAPPPSVLDGTAELAGGAAAEPPPPPSVLDGTADVASGAVGEPPPEPTVLENAAEAADAAASVEPGQPTGAREGTGDVAAGGAGPDSGAGGVDQAQVAEAARTAADTGALEGAEDAGGAVGDAGGADSAPDAAAVEGVRDTGEAAAGDDGGPLEDVLPDEQRRRAERGRQQPDDND